MIYCEYKFMYNIFEKNLSYITFKNIPHVYISSNFKWCPYLKCRI